jgi:tetratricopeptide (TPR) repeat protein
LSPDASRDSEKSADLFREAAAKALQRLEAVRKTTDEEERKQLRAYLDGIIGQVSALQRIRHYQVARQALDEALREIDKGRYRTWWIEVLTRRANSLSDEAKSGTANNSRESVAAAIRDYRQLLQELTGAADRQDWANTQTNLGLALQSQGERSSVAEVTTLLAEAVEAHRAALQVYSKEDLPRDWARAQSNLGLAL